MKLITRQTLADEAPARFADAYRHSEFIGHQAIKQKLALLRPPIDPDEVDRIIGNKTWTEVPKCDECATEGLPHVVQLGEEPDYDSSTATICQRCICAALKLLG